jgi:hypothetical protein
MGHAADKDAIKFLFLLQKCQSNWIRAILPFATFKIPLRLGWLALGHYYGNI